MTYNDTMGKLPHVPVGPLWLRLGEVDTGYFELYSPVHMDAENSLGLQHLVAALQAAGLRASFEPSEGKGKYGKLRIRWEVIDEPPTLDELKNQAIEKQRSYLEEHADDVDWDEVGELQYGWADEVVPSDNAYLGLMIFRDPKVALRDNLEIGIDHETTALDVVRSSIYEDIRDALTDDAEAWKEEHELEEEDDDVSPLPDDE